MSKAEMRARMVSLSLIFLFDRGIDATGTYKDDGWGQESGNNNIDIEDSHDTWGNGDAQPPDQWGTASEAHSPRDYTGYSSPRSAMSPANNTTAPIPPPQTHFIPASPSPHNHILHGHSILKPDAIPEDHHPQDEMSSSGQNFASHANNVPGHSVTHSHNIPQSHASQAAAALRGAPHLPTTAVNVPKPAISTASVAARKQASSTTGKPSTWDQPMATSWPAQEAADPHHRHTTQGWGSHPSEAHNPRASRWNHGEAWGQHNPSAGTWHDGASDNGFISQSHGSWGQHRPTPTPPGKESWRNWGKSNTGERSTAWGNTSEESGLGHDEGDWVPQPQSQASHTAWAGWGHDPHSQKITSAPPRSAGSRRILSPQQRSERLSSLLNQQQSHKTQAMDPRQQRGQWHSQSRPKQQTQSHHQEHNKKKEKKLKRSSKRQSHQQTHSQAHQSADFGTNDDWEHIDDRDGWGDAGGAGDADGGWGAAASTDWGQDGGEAVGWGQNDGEAGGWGAQDGGEDGGWGQVDGEAIGWGQDQGGNWGGSSGQAEEDPRRVRFSPKSAHGPWSGSQADTSYSMPSQTLLHAYKATKTPINPGAPRSQLDDYADMRFIDSKGAALKPVEGALFGKERRARDRIHWLFPSDKDERVRRSLEWIQAKSYELGTFGLHKFLQTRERGALITNADYRTKGHPNDPAFDWITFDKLRRSMDQILQESVAFYDPAVQVIIIVFLPSKSGNSVAMWRRKVKVPNNIRLMLQTQINHVLDGLEDESDYVIHVDELPSERDAALAKSFPPPIIPPKKKKKKWWQKLFG
ncbi:hypothetical protein BD779DRAFT_363848 [Infundibulicybe gibba]|nr:hypothetical protein BD779DRAFT_363848 [Infundibulicybe gibba]